MQGRTERDRRGAVPPGAVLCGVFAVGVVAVAVVGAVLAPDPLPVSTDEVRGVMAATRSVALAGGDVCRGAGSATLCERSRDAVRGRGPATTTVVSDRQLQDGSRVVEVTGRLTSGGRYDGFVQVVRQEDGAVAVDPVYWADRAYAGEA